MAAVVRSSTSASGSASISSSGCRQREDETPDSSRKRWISPSAAPSSRRKSVIVVSSYAPRDGDDRRSSAPRRQVSVQLRRMLPVLLTRVPNEASRDARARRRRPSGAGPCLRAPRACTVGEREPRGAAAPARQRRCMPSFPLATRPSSDEAGRHRAEMKCATRLSKAVLVVTPTSARERATRGVIAPRVALAAAAPDPGPICRLEQACDLDCRWARPSGTSEKARPGGSRRAQPAPGSNGRGSARAGIGQRLRPQRPRRPEGHRRPSGEAILRLPIAAMGIHLGEVEPSTRPARSRRGSSSWRSIRACGRRSGARRWPTSDAAAIEGSEATSIRELGERSMLRSSSGLALNRERRLSAGSARRGDRVLGSRKCFIRRRRPAAVEDRRGRVKRPCSRAGRTPSRRSRRARTRSGGRSIYGLDLWSASGRRIVRSAISWCSRIRVPHRVEPVSSITDDRPRRRRRPPRQDSRGRQGGIKTAP